MNFASLQRYVWCSLLTTAKLQRKLKLILGCKETSKSAGTILVILGETSVFSHTVIVNTVSSSCLVTQTIYVHVLGLCSLLLLF